MSFIFNISVLFFLIVLAYQDFKSRQISLWSVIFLFVVLFCLSYLQNGIKQAILLFSINLLFTAVELLFIFIYLKLRKKINSFSDINSFFGWGDVLFLVVLCLAFSPMNYIFFTLSGTTACFLFLIANSLLTGNKIGTIEVPYAGILAACLALLIIYKIFIHTFNFYDDLLLLNFINE